MEKMEKDLITEDYVSYKTAQLLKKKGFDAKCSTYYISDDEIAGIPITRDFNNNGIFLSAPTLQMAMKWMREVHGLFIQIKPSFCIKKIEYEAEIMSFQKKWTVVELVKYDTYEEIAEAAIKHCLTKMEDK